ncbi:MULTISPECIES: hypothetical protein [Gammaproteobacteria]|uniref:hypothetical protein n=1 Tax=Gammaproteobacteria TaxID=1236 RepID=UPI001AD97937|nr:MULTISPECIES: hypothetical protein [Gammaproteobacteria]MBO9482970.1 hypothetical protein [Salinisphaera sp. G21_0]MBO9496667.1 hypothetical protein [Thalassotalea sp. G20_0]
MVTTHGAALNTRLPKFSDKGFLQWGLNSVTGFVSQPCHLPLRASTTLSINLPWLNKLAGAGRTPGVGWSTVAVEIIGFSNSLTK